MGVSAFPEQLYRMLRLSLNELYSTLPISPRPPSLPSMSKTLKTNEEYVEGGESEGPTAVVATSALAARFEQRQHSLTRMEAIKENIWPLAWCK